MSLTNTQPSSERVVTVRGLVKSYGGRRVVDHLDLDVHTGQVVGLIGANGAGKTTTVEILQGLRRPDAGEVRVLGLDPLVDADRLRPQLGSQLQSSGLPDRLRVGEAVRLFAGPRATSGGGMLLEQFGLAHLHRSPFAGLSGGEQQRLFLVLALLNRPRLVILDELTQGLDPAARREVWSAVVQLRNTGTTVLLVTHELDETERLCDHVIAMREGRVLDQGTPAELVARHAHEVTVRFGLEADLVATADTLQVLNRLPGVTGVTRDRGDAVVRGTREAIAHVGAWLVGSGSPIPKDLRVDIPDLESALLALLDEDHASARIGAAS